MPQAQRAPEPPPIPAEAVREGSRWRHHRPSAEEVASWFKSQPLDEGMEHEHYIGGVVLIPQSEKVKHRLSNGNRVERFEDTYTPYVQVGTRIAYFRQLAEQRQLISVIEPVRVPVIDDRSSSFFNANMEDGYWWHVVVGEGGKPVRFLCCTMRVALYERESYLDPDKVALPVLEGRSTKQVGGGVDINQLAKAQTSAIGRALGVAGILTLGTGVATAEDMLELGGAAGVIPDPDAAELPGGGPQAAPERAADPAAELTRLRERAYELQSMMQQETPEAWRSFAAWWAERSREEGWTDINAVPLDSLKGVISKMERAHAEALAHPLTPEADA